MRFSIQYDTDFASYTIAEYLDEWATLFGDSNHTSGNVDDNNSGGFWGETNATYGGTPPRPQRYRAAAAFQCNRCRYYPQ